MQKKLVVKDNVYCAGVYGLRDIGTGKTKYIGSGIEVNDCLSRHLYYLKGIYM